MHVRRSRPAPPSRPVSRPQARRIDPDRRPDGSTRPGRDAATPPAADRGRLIAAALSAVFPGLGQLANRDARLALVYAGPVLAALAILWLLLQLTTPVALAARVIVEPIFTILLVLNGVLLLWRLASVGQAFLHPRFAARPTGRGWLGLALVMAFVALPHGLANLVGTAASAAFDESFQGGTAGSTAPPPGPGTTERLNVLLVGVDAGPGRTAALADTLIVASLDPVGKTVTMVSIPRDMVNVPLPNGDVYAPKINSLLGYADRHPEEFREGGLAALKGAIGTLLGIPVHHYVEADLAGFVRMVDAIGGVDIDVKKALDDPKYDGLDGRPKGWSVGVGRHHFDGEDALAYARIRRTAGESDFTRAERQQQVLVAMRDAAVKPENLLRLPALIEAVGDAVRTDLPRDRIPQLAAIAEQIGGGQTVRIVIRHPLVAPGNNRYGSVQVPDIPAIRAVAAAAFTEPGVEPQPWPTPKPTPTPRTVPSGDAAPVP